MKAHLENGLKIMPGMGWKQEASSKPAYFPKESIERIDDIFDSMARSCAKMGIFGRLSTDKYTYTLLVWIEQQMIGSDGYQSKGRKIH